MGEFVFLDPFANLLAWSEDFARPVWTVTPGLLITAGVQDPFAGANACLLENTTPAEVVLQQRVNAPAPMTYCFSLYIRAGAARMFATAGGQTFVKACAAQSDWVRTTLVAGISEAESVTVGVQLDPGTSITIYGPQVEAQWGASAYKRSTAFTGVYRNARFDQDELTITADAPNSYSTEIAVTCLSEE
jgi:hypothetical protein